MGIEIRIGTLLTKVIPFHNLDLTEKAKSLLIKSIWDFRYDKHWFNFDLEFEKAKVFFSQGDNLQNKFHWYHVFLQNLHIKKQKTPNKLIREI